MALVCLGSVLKENHISVALLDCDFELKKTRLSSWSSYQQHFRQRLEEAPAEIYGLSSLCSNFPLALLLAREIRQCRPDAKIILGGPQPSAVPKETLKVFPEIDVVVVGEGENTLLELTQCDWSLPSLRRIPGIVFQAPEGICHTERRPLIDDLDDLPFPDFSLLPLKDYLELYTEVALIEAGRGCPFLCSFCSTSLMWERTYRTKSSSRILEEMRSLHHRYGLDRFSLTHDNFTTSHSYVDQFSSFFAAENHEGFRWSISARPDTINKDRLQALAAGGCGGLFFGIDTGSPKIQDIIQKHLDLNHVRRMLTTAVDLGIEVTSSFIVGYAEETMADLDQTLRWALEAKRLGSDAVQIHALSPLTGTSICEENSNQLYWDPETSDLSLHPLHDDTGEIFSMIGQYPRLFSSFYTVPTPHLGEIPLTVLAATYQPLMNKFPENLDTLSETTGLSPTELFQKWLDWLQQKHPQAIVGEDFVTETFHEFRQEALVPFPESSIPNAWLTEVVPG